MYHFDQYSVLLAIAANIPQRLKTGFVLQGHTWLKKNVVNDTNKNVIIFMNRAG